jgi:hypothetical protein
MTEAAAELVLDIARRHVLAAVCFWPGSTTTELDNATGFGEEVVAELLAELEAERFVSSRGGLVAEMRWSVRWPRRPQPTAELAPVELAAVATPTRLHRAAPVAVEPDMTRLQSLIEKVRARLVPEEINGGERCPTYLYRWQLLELAGVKVYLHRIVADDWALDLHDHPKRFISIGLAGSYHETSVEDGIERRRWWHAPWFRTFPAEHRHRLRVPFGECWTLVIVGRPEREWGFWSDGRWIQWRRYVETVPGSKVACQ